jgi:LuxR family maltose regulon positive regulatory protein
LSELSWPEALADPELAFIRATADTFTHEIDAAQAWLDVASAGPADLIGSMGLPLGYRIDFLRAIVGVNDATRAAAAARAALAAAPAPQWEGVALAGLGQALYLRGLNAEAQTTLRRAVSLIPDGNPNLLVFAIGNLGLAEYADGSAARAGRMLDPALEMMRTTGLQRSPVGAILHMACGERARSEADPRSAAGWFASAIDILGRDRRSAWLANAYLLHAGACRALGDLAEEARALDAADAILDRLPDPGALPARSQRLRQDASAVVRHVTEFGEELSDREIAVLRLAADGLTQREIADQLFISYNTVKSHLKATYRKLGATSRDDALTRLADMVSPGEPTPPG